MSKQVRAASRNGVLGTHILGINGPRVNTHPTNIQQSHAQQPQTLTQMALFGRASRSILARAASQKGNIQEATTQLRPISQDRVKRTSSKETGPRKTNPKQTNPKITGSRKRNSKKNKPQKVTGDRHKKHEHAHKHGAKEAHHSYSVGIDLPKDEDNLEDNRSVLDSVSNDVEVPMYPIYDGPYFLGFTRDASETSLDKLETTDPIVRLRFKRFNVLSH